MKSRLTAALLLAALAARGAGAEPLHDPFLERFEVGIYRDGVTVDLETGYPADLLLPVRADTAWIAAARDALENGPGDLHGIFLSALLDSAEADAWRSAASAALDAVANGGDEPATPHEFLAAERAACRFFALVGEEDLEGASRLARWIAAHADDLDLPSRAAFVWELRALQLEAMTSPEPCTATGPWPAMLDLAPWDRGNAWALWRAQCRHFGAELLPDHVSGDRWADLLAGLGSDAVDSADLAASAFDADLLAGLGGVLLEGADLAAHFDDYPTPPSDFDAQGWWVRGRRLFLKGNAEDYEHLASRSDLDAGWRMDVWRRASERRLLKGRWEEGLRDLKVALALAGKKCGTSALRRRTRQWAEQAMVLALSEGRTDDALDIRHAGLESLVSPEHEAFLAEVGHWDELLGLDTVSSEAPERTDLAARVVSTGDATALAAPGDSARESFTKACKRDLWPDWYAWGLELADPAPVTGARRAGAIAYGNALERGLAAGAAALRDTAVTLAGRRFRGRPVGEDLLRQAFLYDVAARIGSGPSVRSRAPDLERRLRGSELDRHALLGLALAAGDMRGVLAVAVNLPFRGLAPDGKLAFLYPLPRPGPLADAIASAAADPALILAVARNESLFEPTVRSRAGALGFMQIMPFHYDGYGVEPGAGSWSDPGVSIAKGAALLAENRRRYDNDPYRAVAAYNAGPTAADRWQDQLGAGRTRSMYLAWIGYPETRRYVEKVLIDREIYDWLIGGPARD